MLNFLDQACKGGDLSCALTRLRVLLAEDDMLVATTQTEILLTAGCTVTMAADGAEALALALAGPAFDLLVTDLAMPVLGGADLIRAVRFRKPRLPVVVVTGQPPVGGAAALQRAFEGRLVLLQKPVLAKQLLEVVMYAVFGKGRLGREAVPRAEVSADHG